MAIIYDIAADFHGGSGLRAYAGMTFSIDQDVVFGGESGFRNLPNIVILRAIIMGVQYIDVQFDGSSGLKCDPEWVGNDKFWPGIDAYAGSKLLYRQATGLEKAWADVEAYRITRTFAELIKDQWDPAEISERNLPYLAWAQGVNLWEHWWSTEFKRYWVANQWTFKAQRGSLLGLKTFVSAVGGTLKRAIVPPAITYPLPRLTLEQRAAYVAMFPQLRMYPYVERVKLKYLNFLGGHGFTIAGQPLKVRNGAYLGPVRPLYPTHQDQGGKYTRTATLWDRGVETRLTMRKIVKQVMGPSAGWGFTPGTSQYDEEILLPARERIFYYIGEQRYLQPQGRAYNHTRWGIFLGKVPALRTITVSRSGPLPLTQGKAQYQTVLPSTELLELYPDHIYQRHPRRVSDCCLGHRFLVKCDPTPARMPYCPFLTRSNAWQYSYDVWYLFDPDRVPANRKTGVYLGKTRLGIHKYTAEAKIKLTTKAPFFFVRSNGYMRGHLKPRSHVNEAIERAKRGVTASMAIRDTVLIDTNVTRKIQVRDLLVADGRHVVGELVQD